MTTLLPPGSPSITTYIVNALIDHPGMSFKQLSTTRPAYMQEVSIAAALSEMLRAGAVTYEQDPKVPARRVGRGFSQEGRRYSILDLNKVPARSEKARVILNPARRKCSEPVKVRSFQELGDLFSGHDELAGSPEARTAADMLGDVLARTPEVMPMATASTSTPTPATPEGHEAPAPRLPEAVLAHDSRPAISVMVDGKRVRLPIPDARRLYKELGEIFN